MYVGADKIGFSPCVYAVNFNLNDRFYICVHLQLFIPVVKHLNHSTVTRRCYVNKKRTINK